ncbi:MAG: hypothetical protein H6732_03770 [Alphaproteobacteria bacterium]|nr:hypothetical protein [Alphaproteobacteria bacterium]
MEWRSGRVFVPRIDREPVPPSGLTISVGGVGRAPDFRIVNAGVLDRYYLFEDGDSEVCVELRTVDSMDGRVMFERGCADLEKDVCKDIQLTAVPDPLDPPPDPNVPGAYALLDRAYHDNHDEVEPTAILEFGRSCSDPQVRRRE